MMNYPGVHSAWPNLMAVGATDDAFVAQDYAVNYGVELRGIGLNMVLSPCGACPAARVCMCGAGERVAFPATLLDCFPP